VGCQQPIGKLRRLLGSGRPRLLGRAVGQGTGGDWRKVEGGGEGAGKVWGGEVAGKVWGGEVAGEVTGGGEVGGQVGEEVGGEVGRKVGGEVRGDGFSDCHPFVCFLLALGHNLVP
jgi:hypothetical protein